VDGWWMADGWLMAGMWLSFGAYKVEGPKWKREGEGARKA